MVAARPVGANIDALLARYEQYGFSGTVLVYRGDQIALSKGYGWAVAEKRIPNAPSTLFDLASLAKTFTAAAILDLEARGRLSTSDRLSRFLGPLPEDKQAITIHHLLTHMSGYPLDMADIGVGTEHDTQELLAKARSAKLPGPPGTTYRYSNVGYGLLAHVIERASGKSWQQYVRERLLKRAGLKNSFLFGERLPPNAQVAQGYMGPSEDRAVPQPPMAHPGRSPLLWGKHPLGAVGVFATVGDVGKWWCSLQGPKLLPLSQRTRLFAIQAANQSYGWNIREAEGRINRIHRGGLRGSYQTLLAYYPERQDLLVYGINKNVSLIWAGLVWRNVERMLQGEAVELPPELGIADEAAILRHQGEYQLGTGGRLIFRKVGGVLYFGAAGQDALDPLEYQGRQKPERRSRIHEASLELARALGRGDQSAATRIANTSPENLAKLGTQWQDWARQIGPWQDADLLGSVPGAENYLRVFVRLKGAGGELVIRLLWDHAKGSLLAWGDEIPLPAYERLWAQSGTEFVAHDLENGRTRYFRFKDGTVTVTSAGGDVLLVGRRS